MQLTIFGLGISSAWGNGHATLWRGLIRELSALGHGVTFFERDVPYYAQHRDLPALPAGGGELVLYPDWETVKDQAREALRHSDVGMVTSYCPDAQPATDLCEETHGLFRCFYDLDAPITLEKLAAGEPVAYVPRQGYAPFDLTLSYTGGPTLELLQQQLDARRCLPLYGSVDPTVHAPVDVGLAKEVELSYLGTYAADRQPLLEELLVRPAALRPNARFAIGGPLYPPDFVPPPNVHVTPHVSPADHPRFYGQSSWTLNLTRAAMAEVGYCPSARLFEAAACGTPLLSDSWPGLEQFFQPGTEIQVVRSAEEVLQVLAIGEEERLQLASRALQRTLREHTAARRAAELVAMLQGAAVGTA